MKTLRRLPRWARVAALGGNLAAAIAVLSAFWGASYPNLIASWAQWSVLATLLVPALAWVDQRLTRHHEAIKAHVDRALAAPSTQPGDGAP